MSWSDIYVNNLKKMVSTKSTAACIYQCLFCLLLFSIVGITHPPYETPWHATLLLEHPWHSKGRSTQIELKIPKRLLYLCRKLCCHLLWSIRHYLPYLTYMCIKISHKKGSYWNYRTQLITSGELQARGVMSWYWGFHQCNILCGFKCWLHNQFIRNLMTWVGV